MLNNFKNLKSVIGLSFICIVLCILTFLFFINPKLLSFSNINLQILIILDIILLVLSLSIIFKKSYNLYYLNKNKKIGSQTRSKYISIFVLFAFIPSFFVAIFSLFILTMVYKTFSILKLQKL